MAYFAFVRIASFYAPTLRILDTDSADSEPESHESNGAPAPEPGAPRPRVAQTRHETEFFRISKGSDTSSGEEMFEEVDTQSQCSDTSWAMVSLEEAVLGIAERNRKHEANRYIADAARYGVVDVSHRGRGQYGHHGDG